MVTVTVQPGDFLTLFIFKRHAYRASLFACLPTHGTSFIHLHIEPAPCRQAKNRRYLRFLRHHAMIWFLGFSITSTFPVLADVLISKIQHCPRWQTDRFLKFCIVVVDRYLDFQNLALLDFYKIEQSRNSTLLIFRKMKISGKLHCRFPWFFTQYGLKQKIYITSRQCWFS